MDINKLIADRVKKAQNEADKNYQEKVEELLSDAQFIEAQRKLSAIQAEVIKLNTIIQTLNEIPPFIANDGRKFNVNVFSVPFFGIGLGQIIGIIQGSRSAFTDEMALQYAAIAGVPMVELQQAALALGSPAYYKDGEKFEAIPGDYSTLVQYIKSIALKMDIRECDINLTEERYNTWFARAEATVENKIAEFQKALALESIDNNTKFTMD